ncbi:amidase [Spiribacter halobius]|nr:amidase [Spiribacter halobius]UEX78202.1 amidase [Spiribacter halobius]
MAATLGPAADYRGIVASSASGCVRLVDTLLAHIEKLEPEHRCFEHIDAEAVRARARWLDERRDALGHLPLYGMPVGVKDIIDVAGLRTSNGLPTALATTASEDAAVVRDLQAQGAIIVGKTVSTELAFLHPARTRNPRGTDFTPGGSSAGSAAGVAAGMVAAAVGTQTGGSVTRPASFCGVHAVKTTSGLIDRTGVLSQSPTLDTVGFLACDAEALAAIMEGLTPLQPPGGDVPGRIGLLAGGMVDRAPDYVREALHRIERHCADRVSRVVLDPLFDRCVPVRQRINMFELRYQFEHFMTGYGNHLSDTLKAGYREGEGVTVEDYFAAIREGADIRRYVNGLLEQFDYLLLPSALGEPPKGLESTGDSLYNAPWSLLGNPTVTLPLCAGPNGMPFGLQLVGRHFSERALIAAGAALSARFAEAL